MAIQKRTNLTIHAEETEKILVAVHFRLVLQTLFIAVLVSLSVVSL